MNAPAVSDAHAAPPAPGTQLRSFYAWIAATTAVAAGLAALFVRDPRVSGGIAAGAAAGTALVASWHILLGRRRRWYAYVFAFAAKYVAVFGGLFLLGHYRWVEPSAIVGGAALPVLAALPFAVGVAYPPKEPR